MSAVNKIGRYQVKRKLGAGGMGEVFLARDSSLDRDVAIKVLLPEFCRNLERVNRFKLEAKAASSLNHPNVITIYEVGEEDDKLFISTEFIKGETLRSLIDRQALDLSSSLNIAEQIASAIAAAHSAGIIHRDIKPENVMVREDGIVKVLDFGLAKPTQVESEAETRELVSTKAGLVMGSVGYMSPEQSRGKELDGRSDLWSLGVVLYEMLMGKTPFEGETMTDILANIIYKEPVPLNESVKDCPKELNRIVKKTLRKDREERYQSAKDFLLDIKNLRREMELEHELELAVSPARWQEIKSRSNDTNLESTSDIATNENVRAQFFDNTNVTQTSQEVAKPKQKISMALAALIGLGTLGGLWWLNYKILPTQTAKPFDKAAISSKTESGLLDGICISRDGKFIAYSQAKQTKNPKLMLRQIETGSETAITAIDDKLIGMLKFSPDGNYLYFVMRKKGDLGSVLYRVPTLGGEIKTVVADIDSGISFRPDGKSFVFHRHIINPVGDKIIEIGSDGGEEKEIFDSENPVFFPQISPDGQKIALVAIDKTAGFGKPSASFVLLENGELKKIGKPWQYATSFDWTSDSSSLIIAGYFEDTKNSKIYRLDIADGSVKSIINDAKDYYSVSLTGDGKTIATVQANAVAGIWRYDLNARTANQISPNSAEILGREGLAVLPNDEFLYVKINGQDDGDIWSMKADGSERRQLTKNNGKNAYPMIAPDGKTVYFESFRNGEYDIWRMNADGSNQVQISKTPKVEETIYGISADGKTVVFSEKPPDNENETLKQINTETGEVTLLIDGSKEYLTSIKLSPDGKQLFYGSAPLDFSNGNIPKTKLYLADYDGKKLGQPKPVPAEITSSQYRWAADGKTLFYTESQSGNADIWQLNPKDGKTAKVTNFNLESIYRYAVSPDGKRLYLVRGSSTQDIVLIKNEDK